MKKKLVATIVTLVLIGGATTALGTNKTIHKNSILLAESVSNGWHNTNGVWQYIINNKPQTGWVEVNNLWYHMNSQGFMETGWIQTNGNWHYMNSDGSMATGWKEVNGKWYRFDSNGFMQVGWTKSKGTWYYMDSSGAMQTGWLELDGSWYYLNNSGAMEIGWIQTNGNWHYMNSDGSMVVGWKEINNEWYSFDSNGAMQIGWISSNGTWYYMNSSGAMQTGWLELKGVWYYLNDNGAKQTGVTEVNGSKYYLLKSGAMVTKGWGQVPGKEECYIYITDSGAMATGWKWMNGYWYYFNPSTGLSASGNTVINGQEYKFDYDTRRLEVKNNPYQALYDIKKNDSLSGKIDGENVYIFGGNDLKIPTEGIIKTKMVFQNNINKLYDITIRENNNRLKFIIYYQDGSIKTEFTTTNVRLDSKTQKNDYGIPYSSLVYKDINQNSKTYLGGTKILPLYTNGVLSDQNLYYGVLNNGQIIKVINERGTKGYLGLNSTENQLNNTVVMSIDETTLVGKMEKDGKITFGDEYSLGINTREDARRWMGFLGQQKCILTNLKTGEKQSIILTAALGSIPPNWYIKERGFTSPEQDCMIDPRIRLSRYLGDSIEGQKNIDKKREFSLEVASLQFPNTECKYLSYQAKEQMYTIEVWGALSEVTPGGSMSE